MTSTSAEQTEAIRQSMQDEKAAKDELIRELVEALKEHVAAFGCITFNPDHHPEMSRAKKRANAVLSKAGAL